MQLFFKKAGKLLLFMIGLSPCICLTDTEPSQKKLTIINAKIETIKASISHDQSARTLYLKKLEAAKIASGTNLKKLKKTTKALQKKQTTLKQLHQNTHSNQDKLKAEQDLLNKTWRSAYLLARQPYLKLVLMQSEADQIDRLLMYYQYIRKDKIATIYSLQKTIQELEHNQMAVQSDANKLKHLAEKERHHQNTLRQVTQNQQHLIVTLTHEIDNKSAKLNALIANKRRLEQTLDRLEKSGNSEPTGQGNFATLKRKLSWPTAGKIFSYFGTQIYESELRWDGVLIQGRENQPVYAVAAGTVAFSKWLPGYGLLLIINHGHGYMTLYGRNHNLYKKSGDKVKAGDLIAALGKSEGYSSPQLYFAIRHNAKPLNPTEWCRGEKK